MPTSSPPTMTPAAERILASASELFYARGITAVGVDLIAETAGTTKKTLYDRFGSKEGLVTAYLRRRCDRWQSFLLAFLDAHEPAAGTARVLCVLTALETWMVDNARGCGFVNAYAELAGTGHSGLAIIAEEKAAMRSLYTDLVQKAGLDEPQVRGARLALVHEGAIVEVTAGGRPEAFADAQAMGQMLLR